MPSPLPHKQKILNDFPFIVPQVQGAIANAAITVIVLRSFNFAHSLFGCAFSQPGFHARADHQGSARSPVRQKSTWDSIRNSSFSGVIYDCMPTKENVA